ncbi:hypothetical protein ACFPPA_16830 [Rhodanobacter ginsengisoli]|uniref:VWFA domain-containing protein n=1 Tax=Rhodanobacter ginsengisoli TaxID=418646 RepID=A0ABW0QX22_9GAMM
MRVPFCLKRDCDTGELDRVPEHESPLDDQCHQRNEGPVGNDRAFPFASTMATSRVDARTGREIAILTDGRLSAPDRDEIIDAAGYANRHAHCILAGLSRKPANPRMVIDGLTCQSIWTLSESQFIAFFEYSTATIPILADSTAA